jgi:hypothetical protein
MSIIVVIAAGTPLGKYSHHPAAGLSTFDGHFVITSCGVKNYADTLPKRRCSLYLKPFPMSINRYQLFQPGIGICGEFTATRVQ